MRLAVVGLGLIGGSLALDLRRCGFVRHVVGVDANPHHAEQARALRIVDDVAPLTEAVANADLVVLCIPVDALAHILPTVLDHLGAHATVADVGSTKELICDAVAAHPQRVQFVAAHPMAGTENSGPTAALSGLFVHKTAVICDAAQSGAEHLQRVEAMFSALDMRIIHMLSSEHDLHAAYVSHLSHISSFVLANTVLAVDQRRIFDLAGGGFESTVRLGKSSPEMWAPIFEQNRTHVLAALESYMDHLKDFHQALKDPQAGGTGSLMTNANRIRQVLADMGIRTTQGSKKP